MTDSSTSQPMDDDLEEALAGYVLGALSPAEMVKVEHFLRSNPQYIEQIRQMQDVMGVMAYSTRTKAPELLRSKILTIPQSRRPVQHPSRLLPIRPSVRLPWRQVGGAIAALVVLTLGIDNVLLRQQLAKLELHRAETQIAEDHVTEEDYVFDLRGTNSTIATAKVIIDADAGEVIIGTQNLPPLPENEAYHLWAFTSDQSKILCGRFNTNSDGQTVSHFSIDPKVYTGHIRLLRISREPISNTSQSSRRVLVMTSES